MKSPERRFLVAADRHVQAHRVAAVLEQIADLLDRDAGLFGQFLIGGFAAQVLVHLTLDPGQLVDLLDQVDRQPDRAALVGHAAGDGLADPPRGVGRELETLAVVELLHRADQTQVALLDQVQQRHAAAGVALGQRHHQPKVGLQQVAAGRFAVADDRSKITFAVLAQSLPGIQQMLGVKPGLDALCEFDLVRGVEQGRFANAVQVHAHEVSGWTLGVQVGVDAARGGICHDGLLIGSNCHELQRPRAPKSSPQRPVHTF